MKDIILDCTQLTTACEPFTFINEQGQDAEVVEEMKATINELKEILNSTDKIIALSAPQIGIKKRVFCIKFSDTIKTFINPVIKRRSEDKFINLEQHVDGKSNVYICRPKEVEVTYFTDEFKVEDNKLLDAAAATFIQQYNLLDGVVAGHLLTMENWDSLTCDDIPKLVDGTYSGIGLVMDTTDDVPELTDVADVLTKVAQASTAKLKSITSDTDNEELRKVARQFWFEENVILGRTKVVDQEGWEKEKKAKRQMAMSKKKAQDASFKQLAAKACK